MTPFDVEKDFVQPTAGVYRESAAPECPKRHPQEVPALWRSLLLALLVGVGGYTGGLVALRAADPNWPFGVLASTAIFGGLAALGWTAFVPWLVTGPNELSPHEREQYAFWRRIHPVRALHWVVCRSDGTVRDGWAFLAISAAVVTTAVALAWGGANDQAKAKAREEARSMRLCRETCTTLGTATLLFTSTEDGRLLCRCADRVGKRVLVVDPTASVMEGSR